MMYETVQSVFKQSVYDSFVIFLYCFIEPSELMDVVAFTLPGRLQFRYLYIRVSIHLPRYWAPTTSSIHTNLSAILRVYNSNQAIKTDLLEILCNNTFEIIVDFPWVNITP